MAEQPNHSHTLDRFYVRFPVAQRIEHLLLILSFGTLALTGLIQKFSAHAVASGMIDLLGGIEQVRIFHRVAAVVFALEAVYHVIVLGYKVYVRRVEMSMLPGLGDLTDALDVVRYNLGLAKERPKLPRYGFEEKAEYWAMIWGTLLMGLTGFMLWNPILTARFLPGQVIPAAKAAHGAEAILAVLAIFVWHFYNVHIKTFNKSMFTGKLTAHQMAEEHGGELERLVSGQIRPAPSPEALRRRERIYLPVAFVGAVVMTGTILWLATWESTAIATLPPPPTVVPAFAPLTPTPVPTPEGGINNANIGAPMKHAVAGMEQCLTCHGTGGVNPYPANHAGRPLESCLICHQPGPTPTPGPAKTGQPGVAGAIPHSVTEAAYQDCLACHGAGKMKPGPANHASFTNESCTLCHKAASTKPAAATPVAGATPAPAGTAPAAGAAKPIPHPIEGDAYKDCTTCHGEGKMKPSPANHASFAANSCTTCHQPASAGGTPSAGSASAKPIPHPIAGEVYKDCTFCHGEGKMKPFPANHTSFAGDTCTTCHKPPQ